MFNILETMGWVSVITNGLIIALTCEFIPKMVYTHHYSEDQTLNGYVNFSLSYFDLTDLDPRSKANVTTGICRYSNYRSGPNDGDPYTPNLEFWHIWVARLLFLVILFQSSANPTRRKPPAIASAIQTCGFARLPQSKTERAIERMIRSPPIVGVPPFEE